MRLSLIPAVAAALFVLLPNIAAAQEAPEVVYGKYHQALRVGNLAEARKYVPEAMRTKYADVPAGGERDFMIALLKATHPQSYTVASKKPGSDGKSLTLQASGMGTDLGNGNPQLMAGVILMQKEGADWKVQKADWLTDPKGPSSARPSTLGATVTMEPESAPRKKPAAAAPRATAAPKAAAAPEPVLRAYRAPCVYKPVMTNEDLERCR